MDSSVSPKDEIWFLRVCHHVSNAVCCLPWSLKLENYLPRMFTSVDYSEMSVTDAGRSMCAGNNAGRSHCILVDSCRTWDSHTECDVGTTFLSDRSVSVCVCVCVCVNCFSSSTDGVFLVRPLPMSFAIKCYPPSSQSRIAVVDDNVRVKYILCTVNFFFLSFRFSGYEDGADVPDLLLYARGVRHVCGRGPQPLSLVASLAARAKIRMKWYT